MASCKMGKLFLLMMMFLPASTVDSVHGIPSPTRMLQIWLPRPLLTYVTLWGWADSRVCTITSAGHRVVKRVQAVHRPVQ